MSDDSSTRNRRRLNAGGLIVLAIVLIATPQVLNPFWTGRVTGWIPLALAALGLNLLTGYNGQISVGHGALYGVGAYATALILNGRHWPFLVTVVLSAVVCFFAGVLVGLPALRIKGLYLALVTLAVAALFPQILEQYSSVTGGSAGLAITTRELNSRGVMADRSISFVAPKWTGLADDQWRYYWFLAIAVVCFLLVRNIVHSRAGRSIIAVRDNETAAEVSGVNVAAAKVFTFGISAALAGVGGSLLALYVARVSSGSFTLLISLEFLVAVVIGGTPSILGPAIGAVFYGVFRDVITPELPENVQAAAPLILGVLLIGLMFVAPGGIVGIFRREPCAVDGPLLRFQITTTDPNPLREDHMSSFRPFRLVAVAAALAMLMTACGRDDDTDKGSSTTAADGSGSTDSGDAKAFIDPAQDCKSYDGTKGIDGDTIKIGTVRPAAGPYSIYDTVTKGLEAYVGAINADGGVKAGDGKTYQLELVKGDDGYDPSKTPGEVQRLVEQEGIFAMVGEIGTSNNLAVRQYMNDNCVPSIGLATGSPEWGKAAEYPWFIGGLPSYATEGHTFMEYLKANKPDAKYALLYQNDDYGKAYQSVIKKDIEGTDITVAAEQSFDPLTEQSPESKVAQLASSNADVFFVGIGGTPCPTAIKSIPASWTPMTYVSITCSGKTAMALTQGHDEGLYSAQATYDPGTTADQSAPAVQEFLTKGAAQGLDQGTLEGGIAAAGWGFGGMFVKGLELTPKVDRATLMNTLFSLKDLNYGLMREGTVANTDGSKDPWVLEDLRIIVRKAGQWTEAAPVVSYDGKSNDFAG